MSSAQPLHHDDLSDSAEKFIAFIRTIHDDRALSDEDLGGRVERIANLLRKNATEGIHPKWSLRYTRGLKPDHDQLVEIAEQVQEGYTFGEAPIKWRLDIED